MNKREEAKLNELCDELEKAQKKLAELRKIIDERDRMTTIQIASFFGCTKRHAIKIMQTSNADYRPPEGRRPGSVDEERFFDWLDNTAEITIPEAEKMRWD